MTRLYTDLAHVYDEMYQSIFDYAREFRQCHTILKKYRCRDVLELGCGSGNLADYFLSAGYRYTGMDIAWAMLGIARRRAPGADFVHGDMRAFSVRAKSDAVLIGGRSFTYMTTNEDVRNTLKCIHRALKPGGILVFDNLDAQAIFSNFRTRMREKVRSGPRIFERRSKLRMNLETGWTWNWDATYTVREGSGTRTFHDHSVLRAFTRDELFLFLNLAGFKPHSTRRGSSSILIVAKKV